MSKKKIVRKKSNLDTASDVLQNLLQNSKSPLGQQFVRWKVWQFWPDVVGPSMAKYTAPVGYDRGRLFIWVSNSTQLQEMTFMLAAIQKKVNDYVGRRWVTSLRLTLDRKKVPTHEQTTQGFQDFLSK